MRRVLASLKYVPAVVCVLLVVAWVVLPQYRLALGFSDAKEETYALSLGCGNLTFWRGVPQNFVGIVPVRGIDARRFTGELGYQSLVYPGASHGIHSYSVPLVLVITCLVPLVIGPYAAFRFPLWSYFAYTALVAAELAYYLR